MADPLDRSNGHQWTPNHGRGSPDPPLHEYLTSYPPNDIETRTLQIVDEQSYRSSTVEFARLVSEEPVDREAHSEDEEPAEECFRDIKYAKVYDKQEGRIMTLSKEEALEAAVRAELEREKPTSCSPPSTDDDRPGPRYGSTRTGQRTGGPTKREVEKAGWQAASQDARRKNMQDSYIAERRRKAAEETGFQMQRGHGGALRPPDDLQIAPAIPHPP